MKIAITLTVLATGLLLAAGDSQFDAGKKIRELHKERIATLRQFADQSIAGSKVGDISVEEGVQARLLLLNAELEASETLEERIKFHQNIVKLLKEKETNMVDAVRTGVVNTTMILKAKADRLKAEIALEEAKVKGVARQAQ